MIDAANRDRAAPGAPPGREAEFHVKVGGHQASCASMVGIMTALWFGHRGADKVAVKPHAPPVFHAIKYLTGELDAPYLRRLRDFGGLQAYPSRTAIPTSPTSRQGRSASARRPAFAAGAPVHRVSLRV